MERFDVGTKPYYSILAVAKNNINGEIHKKHVDGIAMRDDQGFAFGKTPDPKQSLHSSPWILGNFNSGSNRGIPREICDHVQIM